MNTRSFLFVLVSIGILFTSITQAKETIISGSFCQPYIGSQAGDFYTSDQAIRNVSSSSRWVTCPIERTVPYNTIGTHWSFVSFHNPSTTESLYCSLRARDSQGGLVAVFGNSSYASGYGGFEVNVDTSAYYGNYGIICRLPAGARLFQIHYEEYE